MIQISKINQIMKTKKMKKLMKILKIQVKEFIKIIILNIEQEFQMMKYMIQNFQIIIYI